MFDTNAVGPTLATRGRLDVAREAARHRPARAARQLGPTRLPRGFQVEPAPGEHPGAVCRQVFGLASVPAFAGFLHSAASRARCRGPVPVADIVLAYRCGAAPASDRVPFSAPGHLSRGTSTTPTYWGPLSPVNRLVDGSPSAHFDRRFGRSGTGEQHRESQVGPFGRTESTGQGAWRTTRSATLPMSACASPVRPWVPITIRS